MLPVEWLAALVALGFAFFASSEERRDRVDGQKHLLRDGLVAEPGFVEPGDLRFGFLFH